MATLKVQFEPIQYVANLLSISNQRSEGPDPVDVCQGDFSGAYYCLRGMDLRETANEFGSHSLRGSAEFHVQARRHPSTQEAISGPVGRRLAVNIMIRQMEWLCALYYALKDKGMSPEEAVALVEQVGLEVYRPVASDLFQFSRLRSAKRSTRVTWLLGLMTRYFFSSPFIHRPIPATGGYSFDVTRCPLANYFSDRGVPELTPHAACNLDYAAAGVFGVDLLRTQTIAGGADHCDFRWRFPDEAAG